MDGVKKDSGPGFPHPDPDERDTYKSTKLDSSWTDNNTNRNTEANSDGYNEGGDFEISCRLEGLDEKEYSFTDIQDVWISNFYESMHIISTLVDEYNYISIVSHPPRSFRNRK